MSSGNLTIVERILLAAFELGAEGETFSAEDLVVRSWELFPSHFGLQGYSGKHPDSNRVLTKIMGAESGLRGKGWIAKTGAKRYRLTEVGIRAATQLKGESDPEDGARLSSLNRSLVAVLKRMLDSSARAKFGCGEVLTFGDACGFWNISPRSTAAQFQTRGDDAGLAIAVALDATKEKNSPLSLPGESSTVSREDLEGLQALSEHLKLRFSREIEVIASRRDERKL